MKLECCSVLLHTLQSAHLREGDPQIILVLISGWKSQLLLKVQHMVTLVFKDNVASVFTFSLNPVGPVGCKLQAGHLLQPDCTESK